MTSAISKTETTVADLAALAAKVEGFERPVRNCEQCGGSGEGLGTVVGWRDDSEWAPPPRGIECRCLAPTWAPGPYLEWDNSPAALAMAVLQTRRWLEFDHSTVVWLGERQRIGGEARHDGTPESIARALLTALLRAHGVEVPSE